MSEYAREGEKKGDVESGGIKKGYRSTKTTTLGCKETKTTRRGGDTSGKQEMGRKGGGRGIHRKRSSHKKGWGRDGDNRSRQQKEDPRR